MVSELTADIKDYIASRKLITEQNANRRQNDATRLPYVSDQMTPEHREVVDDQQSSVQRRPSLTQLASNLVQGREEIANIVREASDVETSESPTCSIRSTDRLIDLVNTSNKELSTPGNGPRGRIFGSSAIPMGRYTLGQHPMTGLENPESGDAHASCSGSGFWCWNWRFWRGLSCGLGVAEKYGRVGSVGSIGS